MATAKKTKPSKYMYNLNVGDWSQDGHNMYEKVLLTSEFPKEDVMQAYIAGCKKVGVSLHDDMKGTTVILCDYEDFTIPSDVIQKLVEHGFNESELENEPDDEGNAYVGCDDVVALFKFFVRVGNPKILLATVEAPEVENLNGFWDKKYNFSMGYGVFSS